MFRYIACMTIFCFAAVNAGLIETHHVVEEPTLAHVGTVVHNSPSAVSHQSFTRFHNKAVVAPVVAPILKTTVHEAPVVSQPLVHTYAAAAPLVHSVPVVHSAPVFHENPAVSVVKSAPLVHTQGYPFVHTSPAAYTLHH